MDLFSMMKICIHVFVDEKRREKVRKKREGSEMIIR
jgi:hypothetical protein